MFQASDITSLSHIGKLLPVLAELSFSSLVLWDFNNTLVMHKDPLIRHQESKHPFFEGIKKDFLQETQAQNKNGKNLLSLAYGNPTVFQPIEADIFDCLKVLRDKGVPTSVLTSCTVGQYGGVENLHEIVLQSLGHNHMDFRPFFPAFSGTPISLPERPSGLFKEGVIFNNNNPKGLLLRKFLEEIHHQTGWLPTEIIYVNDLLHHVEEVETHVQKMGIPFKGFHYTYVNDHMDTTNPSPIKTHLQKVLTQNEGVFEDLV